MSDQVITPAPGRVVWYYPSQDEINAKAFAYGDPTKPLAATVAYVWHDRMVNLSVLDQNGTQFRRTSVLLVQPGDDTPANSQQPFATWMPYQIAQAKAQADVGTTGETSQPPQLQPLHVNRQMTDEERNALVAATAQAQAAPAEPFPEPEKAPEPAKKGKK